MKFEIASLRAEYESYRSRKNEPFKAANKMYIWPEGESVLNNLPSNQFVIREIDKVKVKGKEIAIGVFELLGQNNK